MNKETFSIEVEYYGDKLRLELPSSISISDFYCKLDTIAHFLTFQNQSIENVYINRANEINNFEVHESIKELNQEIDTLENKIIELEEQLKESNRLKDNFSNRIDELIGANTTLYKTINTFKEDSNKTFYSNPMDETTPVITTNIQTTSTDIGTFTYTKDDI